MTSYAAQSLQQGLAETERINAEKRRKKRGGEDIRGEGERWEDASIEAKAPLGGKKSWRGKGGWGDGG